VLAAYILATIGAGVMLWRTRTVPVWQVAIPVVTLLVLGYTIYRNLVPYPSGPTFCLPITAAIWIVISLIVLVARPALAQRIGAELASEDGLTTAQPAAPVSVAIADGE